MDEAADAWVFHAGALGDSVLVWPFVRALAHRWERVHVVMDAEKSRLAAAWIVAPGEVVAHDAQRREFTRLWAGEAEVEHSGAGVVYSFVAEDGTTWMGAARGMFPGARVVAVGAPGEGSRVAAWREAGVERWGGVPARSTPSGPVVLHVGAGSGAKRWGMERWRELAGSLEMEATVLAGEVEAERFSAQERASFEAMGGVYCRSLDELREHLGDARGYVGADTGPTHLAAQLGLPTLALFGPTDPGLWKPVGPRVRVLHPATPSGMEWLGVDRVRTALEALLA